MTAQISDGLIVDGETANLRGCPALPWHHPRLKKVSDDVAMKAYAERVLRNSGSTERNPLALVLPVIFSSACWRNYIADWRIDQNRLYLERIDGIYRLEGEEPLLADWVTETLLIGLGEMLTYVHMGFGSVFEEELLLDVRMGMVIRRAVRDNRCKMHDEESLSWEHLPSADTLTPGWKPGEH